MTLEPEPPDELVHEPPAGIVLGAVAQLDNSIVFPVIGAAAMVVLGFVYARLLGRLVWYCEVKPTLRKNAAKDSPAADTPAPPAKV